jgi:predicted nucleic acid-binding Zn ribbon protein
MAEAAERKILKCGKIPEPPTFMFHCPFCGTEWEYDGGEIDYVYFYKNDGSLREVRPCEMHDDCPVCGKGVDSRNIIDTTEE